MSLGGYCAIVVEPGTTLEGWDIYALHLHEAGNLTDVEGNGGQLVLAADGGAPAAATSLSLPAGVTWLRLNKFTPSVRVTAYAMNDRPVS